MSSPSGALGYYLTTTKEPPRHVAEERWEGIEFPRGGFPEWLGADILLGISATGGDLQRFLRERVLSVWDDPNQDRRVRSEHANRNVAFCYVIDVEKRRLDVFATYIGGEGVLAGSIEIDADGRAHPASFDQLVLPPPPEDDSPTPEHWAHHVDEFIGAACARLGLDPARARAALVRASALEARANEQFKLPDDDKPEGGVARPVSVYSFWRAADESGLDRKAMLDLVDAVASDILHELVPARRFLLWSNVKDERDPQLEISMFTREISPEERDRARTDPKLRFEIAEPYLVLDWCDPFLHWVAGASSTLPELEATPAASVSAASIDAIVAGCLEKHALSPERFIAEFGALFEEFVLLEPWELVTWAFQSKARPVGSADDAPEEWLEAWNPLVVGGSAGSEATDGRIQLGNVALEFPRAGRSQWPRLVLFRADDRRAVSRLTPFALAKQGPRRLGNSKSVLVDLFAAIGSAHEGQPVRVDERGVVFVQENEEWQLLIATWVFWLHLFEWIERRQH